MLTEIMEDKNAPINYLLNRDYILEILETDGNAFSRPCFGQYEAVGIIAIITFPIF